MRAAQNWAQSYWARRGYPRTKKSEFGGPCRELSSTVKLLPQATLFPDSERPQNPMSQEVEALLPFPPSSQDTRGPIVVYVNRPNTGSFLKLRILVWIIQPGKKIRAHPRLSCPTKQVRKGLLYGVLTSRPGASTSPGQLGSRAIGIGQELVSQEVEVWLKVEVLR